MVVQDIDRDMKIAYCKKHPKPAPMLPCRIFDDVLVGYYCVSCYSFVHIHNPEIDLIKKFVLAKVPMT